MYNFVKINNIDGLVVKKYNQRSMVLTIENNKLLLGPVLNSEIIETKEISDELMLVMDILYSSLLELMNNDKLMYIYIYGDINTINKVNILELFDPNDENDNRLIRIMKNTSLKKYM